MTSIKVFRCTGFTTSPQYSAANPSARSQLFYLCYSRAGFQSGYLDVQQTVLDRREAQL